MHVEQLTVGPFASNCYIVCADPAQGCLVVDPGADAPDIIRAIRGLGSDVAAYPLTHGHIDHVFALKDVHAAFPAPIGIHPADGAWAFSEFNLIPPFPSEPAKPDRIERAWADGQAWTDAGMTYRVIFTPGHSPGGVCFHFEADGILIAGDTIFRESVGRTDLPGGNERLLARSLKRLMELPDDTVVYPGHGPETTIGWERAHNPFVRGWGCA